MRGTQRRKSIIYKGGFSDGYHCRASSASSFDRGGEAPVSTIRCRCYWLVRAGLGQAREHFDRVGLQIFWLIRIRFDGAKAAGDFVGRETRKQLGHFRIPAIEEQRPEIQPCSPMD